MKGEQSGQKIMNSFGFTILLLGVLAECAFGYNLECITRKGSRCFSEFSRRSNEDPCQLKSLILKCVKIVTMQCSTTATIDFDKIESEFSEICTPGTWQNNEYMRHKDCITSAFKPFECMPFVKNYMKKAIANVPEFLKEACRKSKDVAECSYRSVDETCGQEARDFAATISEPLLKLIQEEFCDKI